MEGALAIVTLVGLGVALYLLRNRVGKTVAVSLNKTIFRRRVERRNRLVGESLFFVPTSEHDPDTIYEIARKSIPATNSQGFTGSGVFIAHERDRMALVKIRNNQSGEIGEIVVSAETMEGKNVARFSVASWLRVHGEVQAFGRLERVRLAWLSDMQLWDPSGHIMYRGKDSPPSPETPSPSTTPLPAAPEIQDVDPLEAETVRRGTGLQCHTCGFRLPKDVEFCPQCGEHNDPQEAQTECENCGEMERAQRNFCGTCGTRRHRPASR